MKKLFFYLICQIIVINLFVAIYFFNILSGATIILLMSGYLIVSGIFLLFLCAVTKRTSGLHTAKAIHFLMYLIVPSKIACGIALLFVRSVLP
jgi:hypothetical protein